MKRLIISVLTAAVLSAGAAAVSAADMPCGCVYCTSELCRRAEDCRSAERVCDGTGTGRHTGRGGQGKCRKSGCGYFCLDNAF